MTLLSEILIDNRLPKGFDAPGHGLVFGDTVRDAILAAQDPTYQHRISPVATTDGRWLCCADVLLEAVSGILAPTFANIDWSLAGAVEVLPWTDAVALLPVPEPLEA